MDVQLHLILVWRRSAVARRHHEPARLHRARIRWWWWCRGGDHRHPRRERLLAGGLRWRRLCLRRRRFLWLHGRYSPVEADRGYGRYPRRQGLLAGGLRRRHLRLRGRRLPRLHGWSPVEPTNCGNGRHPGRQRLLAGGLRRRHLRLRGRRLPWIHGGKTLVTGPGSDLDGPINRSPRIPQARNVVTEIPGPRSRELERRRWNAVASAEPTGAVRSPVQRRWPPSTPSAPSISSGRPD